jgi:hypothetical protein
MPWYRGAFLRSLSFLRRQPYIDECAIYSGQEWDTDLDRYLLLDRARERHHVTLLNTHFPGIRTRPSVADTPGAPANRPASACRSPRGARAAARAAPAPLA